MTVAGRVWRGDMNPVESDREAVDEFDPELEALPAPPRGRRLTHVFLLAAVIVLAAVLVVRLLPDVGYYLSASAPADLGRVGAIDARGLDANRYVRVVGMPMLGRAVRFRRFVRPGVFRVFPLMNEDRLLVQVYLPASGAERGASPVEFAGRLVPLGRAPRGYGAVIGYLRDALGHEVPAGAFVLIAGERPSDLWWAPWAMLVLVAFIVTNSVQLVRSARRLPAVAPQRAQAA